MFSNALYESFAGLLLVYMPQYCCSLRTGVATGVDVKSFSTGVTLGQRLVENTDKPSTIVIACGISTAVPQQYEMTVV